MIFWWNDIPRRYAITNETTDNGEEKKHPLEKSPTCSDLLVKAIKKWTFKYFTKNFSPYSRKHTNRIEYVTYECANIFRPFLEKSGTVTVKL